MPVPVRLSRCRGDGERAEHANAEHRGFSPAARERGVQPSGLHITGGDSQPCPGIPAGRRITGITTSNPHHKLPHDAQGAKAAPRCGRGHRHIRHLGGHQPHLPCSEQVCQTRQMHQELLFLNKRPIKKNPTNHRLMEGGDHHPGNCSTPKRHLWMGGMAGHIPRVGAEGRSIPPRSDRPRVTRLSGSPQGRTSSTGTVSLPHWKISPSCLMAAAWEKAKKHRWALAQFHPCPVPCRSLRRCRCPVSRFAPTLPPLRVWPQQ